MAAISTIVRLRWVNARVHRSRDQNDCLTRRENVQYYARTLTTFGGFMPVSIALYKSRETDRRGTIEDVLPIIGLPRRTVQSMAAAGKIPGAVRLAGSRRWTFNLDLMRRWIERQEMDARRERDHLMPRVGFGPKSIVRTTTLSNSSDAYELAMRRLLAGGGGR